MDHVTTLYHRQHCTRFAG